MTHKSAHKNASMLALLAVLLLAAVLRIYHITQQSIWFDEAFTWHIVIQDDMWPRIAADTHPPLYYVMLRTWMDLAGDSPLAMRYLSALTALVTVAIVYRVAMELVRGRANLRAVPLLAMLVFALSDAEIFLAQEARNYSLYTCLAALGMWTYLRWLRQPSWRRALWWAISTAALMYTHYQGLFIPIIQGVHALLYLRGRTRLHAIGALSLAGLLVMPWFALVTIPQAQNAIDNSLPFAIPSNWDIFLHLGSNYLGAQWALMVLLMLAGTAALWRAGRVRSDGFAFLVITWLVLPFVVLFFGNYFAALLTERKLLIIAPAIALLVGAGLGWLRNPARFLLAAAIVIYGLAAVDYYRVKEPWDNIVAEAAQYAQPGDLALVEAGVGQYPVKYYVQRLMPEGVIFSTLPFLADDTMAVTRDPDTYYQLWMPQLYAQNQEGRTDDVATAWLVYWSPDRRAIHSLEDAGYARTMTTTTMHLEHGLDLYRYDYLPEEPLERFDNGMMLHAAHIDPDALRVDLWWSYTPADERFDYTTTAQLLNAEGALMAQYDSPPFYGQRPTAAWDATEVVFDPKPLELVSGMESLSPGDYTVIVQVYRWTPEGIIQARTSDGDPWIEVGTISVK